MIEEWAVAERLYQQVINDEEHKVPNTYADLVRIVMPSLLPVENPLVFWCEEMPFAFKGVQIGDGLYINGSPHISDYQRMHILAHEWCHWLRQTRVERSVMVRMYYNCEDTEIWDTEERIARAFERLF